jgi:hypothetical protein
MAEICSEVELVVLQDVVISDCLEGCWIHFLLHPIAIKAV